MPLQIRRGNNAERQQITPAAGELIYVTDTKVIYIGDGTTQGGVPVINYSSGTIKDLAAEVFTQGVHNGITFTYNPLTNRINANVDPDLTDYQGTIGASAFKGSFFADDSTRLLNGIDGSVNLDGTVKTNVIPGADGIYDLGSPTDRFNELYLAGPALYLGAAQIVAIGSTVNLPAGSTVAGVPIGTGTGGTGDGVIEGSNYKINIYGPDSTLIVDADNGFLQGDLVGSIQGNVFGPGDSTLILDADTATLYGSVENAGLRITTNGEIIGKRTFGGIDSPIDIGNAGIPSTLRVFSDQRLIQGFGTTDGTLGLDIEVSVSRGTMIAPTIVQQGDLLGGIRYEAHDGIDYQFASQLNFLIDPRTTPSAGNIQTVTMIDFPPDTTPGDRSFVFDGGGDFHAPNSVKTSVNSLGAYDLTDPTVSLFTTYQDRTAVSGTYTQLATSATETEVIFSYPKADYMGGKVLLIVKNGTTGGTSVTEHKLVNTTSAVSDLVIGSMLTEGTAPIANIVTQVNGANIDIGFDTSATNTAGDVLTYKAVIELFTV